MELEVPYDPLRIQKEKEEIQELIKKELKEVQEKKDDDKRKILLNESRKVKYKLKKNLNQSLVVLPKNLDDLDIDQ